MTLVLHDDLFAQCVRAPASVCSGGAELGECVEFGHDDDVTGHCDMTGRAVFHQRLYRWLDGVLT